MANSAESILPPHIRKTFEQFGVIKPAAWPKLDTLVKAITGRKYRYDLHTDQTGTCTARVMAQGETFTAIDAEPERALAIAFHDCLKATGSLQIGMFDEDDADDGDEPSPAHTTPIQINPISSDDMARLISSPTPSGPSRFVRTTSRTPDGQVIRFDEQTGAMVDEDGSVLDIDPVEADRIHAELTRARG